MPKGVYKRTKPVWNKGNGGYKLEKNIGRVLSKESLLKMSNSLKGRKAWNKGIERTEECKNKISTANTGRKHSEEAREKMSKSRMGRVAWNKGLKGYNSGEKSSNWKGGVTTVNAKIRNSIEYKLWRDAVFAREGYICQKCDNKGGDLEAHHILNFSSNPELRFAIDNGVCFCKDCHKEFHSIYGIKNNNQEQVKNYINKE